MGVGPYSYTAAAPALVAASILGGALRTRRLALDLALAGAGRGWGACGRPSQGWLMLEEEQRLAAVEAERELPGG